ASAAILETATASTGQIIENRRIVELPLNGRNPFALAQISPGVTSIEGPSFLRAFDINGTASISIGGSVTATGGAVARSNDFTLDGAQYDSRQHARLTGRLNSPVRVYVINISSSAPMSRWRCPTAKWRIAFASLTGCIAK